MNKKTNILLIACFFFKYGISNAQYIMDGDPFHFCAMNSSCYNSVPNRLATIVDEDYLPGQAIYETEQFMNAHPGFSLISPASLLYNCHGFAYSVAQGGERIMIGWTEELCSFNGLSTTSYVVVPENEVRKGDIATIVEDNVYPLRSRHSSIVYNEDTLISKWGYYPLFKHQ